MKTSEGFVMADSRNLPKVDYMMLLQFMRENDVFNIAEIRGAKVMLSSRDSYVETAVGYVEVKREANSCFVKGRVTPEHKVRTKMYIVLATMDELEEKIVKVKCQDCAASEGGCKHVICFLMWLIKRTDEPSVTAVQRYWTQPKLSEAVVRNKCIAAKEMGKRLNQSDISFPESLSLTSFINNCRERNIKNSLTTNYNGPATVLHNYSIFRLILDYSCGLQNEPNFTDFKTFAETKLTHDILNEIEKNTRGQADCPLWYTMKQGRVSASKIYECTKCKTDGSLVKSILGGYKIPETKAIKRGKKLEAEVIKEIEKSMNITITKCGFMLITPVIGASPDGICEDQNFTIEIKCPYSVKTIENYVKDNNISIKCKAQVQLQMCAMGKTKALFCVADPNFENNKSYQAHWVYYDKLFVEKLLTEAEIFWKEMIFGKMLDIAK